LRSGNLGDHQQRSTNQQQSPGSVNSHRSNSK
jgi:hypothetical protein